MKKLSLNKTINKNTNKPYRSAGMFYTSSAGTIMGLISLYGNQKTLFRDGSLAPVFTGRAPSHLGSSLRTALNSVSMIAFIIVSAAVSLMFNLAINTDNTHAASSTLSLTVSSNSIEMSMLPSSPNGTFAKSADITITASTNNATGYTLSVAASNSTNYNKLINSDSSNGGSSGSNSNDNADTLISVTEGTTEEVFSNFANVSYNGKWGYKPSKYNSTNNNLFLPAPPQSGDILDVTTAANSTANTYTMSIGARVDSSKKLGSYSNTYNVILVGNAIPYTITFDDTLVTNMPTDIDSTSATATITLPNNVPVRDGYTFLGWCDTTPTINVGSADTCSGTQYAAGGTWTLDQTGGSNNLHLYTMWNKSIGQCASKDTCMQFMDRNKLSTLMPTVGSTTTLYDMRDGQAYTIALLADGKYWMTKNLNLAGGTTLHSYDTDMPEGYTLPTANRFQAGNKLPTSATAGFNDNTKAFVYNSDSTACGNNSPCYSYYSWTAATLGSGLSISTENTDAPYSICPKGWRLPTSGNSSDSGWKRGDFYQLATNYGVNLSSSSSSSTATFYNNSGPGTTPNFLLAGYYSSGSFNNGGSYGGYWSSTSYGNSSSARVLRFSSGNVASALDYGRTNGFSVRCIFAN